MSQKTRKLLRIGVWILFVIYLGLLCYFLFFSEMMGRTYSERSYHYNLMPLKEIKRFIIYRKVLGTKAVCFNLLGNIVAFIPYGMLLPLLAHNRRKFYRIVLLSFDFSLLVELVQLVSKVGSFDVDDLILNTIGGAIGYVGFLLANHIRCHKFEQKE